MKTSPFGKHRNKISSETTLHAMDKKNKDLEKKTGVKDRGDLSKATDKIVNSKTNATERIGLKEFAPDRGDSQVLNKNSRLNGNRKPDEIRSSVKREATKKDNLSQVKTYLDLEGRKRLRERYTLRLKNSQNFNKNLEVKVEDKEKDKNDKRTDEESIAATCSTKNSVYTEPRSEKKLAKETLCSQRKPVIKTVTIKNDNRVYKAVTFGDHRQHTPLQINIPTHKKNNDSSSNFKLKVKPSKESFKQVFEKPVKKVKKRGKKRILSPELFTRGKSPPTEVAKWAPSCINHHTKPYYEAWVDTTLAAISGASMDMRFYEKQNIIKKFQKALLERPNTPDLLYENYNDERYTGRIKVRQR